MSIAIDRGLSAATTALQTVQGNAAATSAPSTTGSSSSTSTSTISASDFMTLLVTEMKNQDPTQPTDPTQYVQQLVGVNSLEQLIDINKGVNGSSATSSVG